MNLEDIINQAKIMGNKDAGQLIKHTDWNKLIESLCVIGETVVKNVGRLDQVEGNVSTLQTDLHNTIVRLDKTEQDLLTLSNRIAPLLDQYLVKTSCDRVRYTMGEICEITAEVTTLTGEPVSGRPWVDFVASWGCLRSFPEFTSRSGVGDNSLSVRVNDDGIARVQLSADHTEGFTDTEEKEVQKSMQTMVEASNHSIAEIILKAGGPSESLVKEAYKTISKEYERKDSHTMSSYIDTYFVRKRGSQNNTIRPSPYTNWRDYRTTVMAMAKPDGDPTSADYSHGGSSIQITFRDWIHYWLHDYTLETHPYVLELIPEVKQVLTHPASELTLKFEDMLDEKLTGKGVIGRKKIFDAMGEAINQVVDPEDPVKKRFKDQAAKAIAVQSSNDVNEIVNSTSGQVARGTSSMAAFLSMQKQSVDLGSEVSELTGKVQAAEDVNQSIAVLEGRMQAAEGVGVNIDQRLNQINDSVKAINKLDETSIELGVSKIETEIGHILNEMRGRG